AGAARRRSHGGSRLSGHHIQIVDQQIRHEAAAVSALVPSGRLPSDAGELLQPFFLNEQLPVVRQKFLEKLGSRLQPIDLILLRAAEEILEAENFIKSAMGRYSSR